MASVQTRRSISVTKSAYRRVCLTAVADDNTISATLETAINAALDREELARMRRPRPTI